MSAKYDCSVLFQLRSSGDKMIVGRVYDGCRWSDVFFDGSNFVTGTRYRFVLTGTWYHRLLLSPSFAPIAHDHT